MYESRYIAYRNLALGSITIQCIFYHTHPNTHTYTAHSHTHPHTHTHTLHTPALFTRISGVRPNFSKMNLNRSSISLGFDRSAPWCSTLGAPRCVHSSTVVAMTSALPKPFRTIS